jgi:hypothetical protein
MFWQSVGMVILGVVFYLVDCLIAHQTHPEVSWLRSGVYNRGIFGVFASVGCVLVGFYGLLKSEMRND